MSVYLFYSSVAPRIHFKQKNESDNRTRLAKGKGRQKCLQVANRKKEMRTTGLRKGCTHISKQTERLPGNNPDVCLCTDGADGTMCSSGPGA